MSRNFRIRCALVCAVLTLITGAAQTVASASGSAAPHGEAAICSTSGLPCAQLVLHMLNHDRTEHGVAPLRLRTVQSSGTASCAGSLGHSVAMARTGTIWHVNRGYPHQSFPNNICLPHSIAGENVGESFRGSVVQDLKGLNMLMMSEPHDSAVCATAANHSCTILDPGFRQVGIGVFVRAGATWLTEDFTN